MIAAASPVMLRIALPPREDPLCRDLPIRPYEPDRGEAAAQSRFVEGRRKTGSRSYREPAKHRSGSQLPLEAIGNAVAVGVAIILVGDAVAIVVAVRPAARRIVVGIAVVVAAIVDDRRRRAVAVVAGVVIAVVVAAIVGGA